MYVVPVCSDTKVTQYMYIRICCKTVTRGKKLREEVQMLPAPSIAHWHLNSLTWASEAIKNIFKIRRYLGCYFLLLLIYKNLHFFPSSQYPPTPPTPSPPPYIVLRAVRVSCPVWSSSSSRVLSGLGRWACKQTRIPQGQYMHMKQVPVPLSMASQTGPIHPHSENPVWSHACSVPVQLALVSSH